MADHVDIVFDGPPGPESGRFIEAEDADGKSIKFGEWIERADGRWALRITAADFRSHAASWTSPRYRQPWTGWQSASGERGRAMVASVSCRGHLRSFTFRFSTDIEAPCLAPRAARHGSLHLLGTLGRYRLPIHVGHADCADMAWS